MGFDWGEDVSTPRHKMGRPPVSARYERARARFWAVWGRLTRR